MEHSLQLYPNEIIFSSINVVSTWLKERSDKKTICLCWERGMFPFDFVFGFDTMYSTSVRSVIQ